MKKAYKIRKSKQIIKQLKPFMIWLSLIEDAYWSQIQKLEQEMARSIGIKDIEFFHVDGSVVGVGNASRTMELIPREDIENFKE